MPEGIPISETVQRKEKHMQGDITVNGKKMTMTEFVELFFETEDKVKERDFQIKKLQKELDELETELRVKEELFKIKGAISEEPCEESRPSIEWYEDRYQSDCITINQLHTTIDVLIDKLAILRGINGYV
jgi:hypothetical protein